MPRPPAGGVRRLPSGKVQARIQLDDAAYSATFWGSGAEARALDYLADLRQRQRGRELAQAARARTLKEQLDDWLTSIRGTTKEKTWEEYRRNALRHLEPLHALPLVDLSRRVLASHLLVTLREAPYSLAPLTLRAVRGTLRRALDQAVEDGYLTANPAVRLKLPKMGPHRQRTHSRAEQRQMIAAAEFRDDRLVALWVFNYRVGARLSEVLGLTWDDVDLERGTVAFWRQLDRTERGRPVWTDTTKEESSIGVVHLPASAIAALRRHRARQDGERLQFAARYRDFNLVFTTRIGTALSQRHVNAYWQRACKLADVPVIVFHEGRHTAASSYLASGASIADVQGVLRHASPHVTMTVYSHLLERTSRAPAEALDVYLTADLDPSREVVGTDDVSEASAGG